MGYVRESGGGNVIYVFQIYSIFEYREEGDSTKGEWMLRIYWLVMVVVRGKDWKGLR